MLLSPDCLCFASQHFGRIGRIASENLSFLTRMARTMRWFAKPTLKLYSAYFRFPNFQYGSELRTSWRRESHNAPSTSAILKKHLSISSILLFVFCSVKLLWLGASLDSAASPIVLLGLEIASKSRIIAIYLSNNSKSSWTFYFPAVSLRECFGLESR